MTVVVVLISRLKTGECGSMCLFKREQARRETQQWDMRRLPTADSIVEIGRKSRSRIKERSHHSSHLSTFRLNSTGQRTLSSSVQFKWNEVR